MLRATMVGILATLLAGCHAAASVADGGAPDLASTADDGAPIRTACVNQYGAALDTTFGRLDGELVAIVDPGHRGCNGDDDHVHLQVRAAGAIYDIAINVLDDSGASVDYLAIDHAPIGAAWAEGWHGDASLDYVSLGLASSAFASTEESTLAADIDMELATANHISVYGSAYSDGSGAHLIHRNVANEDGAIVIEPLSSTVRVLAFHFVDQSF